MPSVSLHVPYHFLTGVIHHGSRLRDAAAQLTQLLPSHQISQGIAKVATQDCTQQATSLSFVVLLKLRIVQVQLAPVLSPVWVILPLAAPLLPKVPLEKPLATL